MVKTTDKANVQHGIGRRPVNPNLVVGAVLAAVLVAALVLLARGCMPGVGAGEGAGAAGAGAGAAGEAGGLVARVHDADGNVHELPLSQDAELVVSTRLGTNVVVVEGGAVCVREADCANRDCVRQGTLVAPGRQIICLPHELWIEVVAPGSAGGQMDTALAAGKTGAEGAAPAASAEGAAGAADTAAAPGAQNGGEDVDTVAR